MKKSSKSTSDPLQPDTAVLVALGSLAVHVEELLDTPAMIKGKTVADQIEGLGASTSFDLVSIRQCLGQIQSWLSEMDKMAFLPKKRN